MLKKIKIKCYFVDLYSDNNKITTTMKTLEIKLIYQQQTAIYNRNLKKIKLQLNSETLFNLKNYYNATSDSHLAKILMLRGVEL